MPSFAVFKDVTFPLRLDDRIVNDTAEIDCVNTLVVRSVRKDVHAFVSPMAVVVVAPSQAVTRVLVTSSFVLPMVEESVVNMMAVPSRLLEVPVSVRLMEEAAGAR